MALVDRPDGWGIRSRWEREAQDKFVPCESPCGDLREYIGDPVIRREARLCWYHHESRQLYMVKVYLGSSPVFSRILTLTYFAHAEDPAGMLADLLLRDLQTHEDFSIMHINCRCVL